MNYLKTLFFILFLFALVFPVNAQLNEKINNDSVKLNRQKSMMFKNNGIIGKNTKNIRHQLLDSSFTLYTPRGTLVEGVYIQPEFDNTYFIYCNYIEYANFYSDERVITIDSASYTYNCHGYAWYTFEHPDTPIVINYIETFLNDGSYNMVDIEDAEKIVYTGNGHSALKANDGSGNFISKWRWGRLVEHPPTLNPYGTTYNGYARAHDVPQEHLTIEEALSNSKNSQTVYVNTNITLSNNISITGSRSLQLKSGNTITLNGYYIAGKIIDGGGAYSPNISLISSSYIAGQFSTFDQAMSYLASGNTLLIQSDCSTSQNITIPCGAVLQINSGYTLSLTSGSLTINGTLNVYGSLNIPSGSSLVVNGAFNAYGTLNFGSGASLVVNGSMYSYGATFQGNGSMGSWNGIQASSGSITNSTIKDATYGLIISSASIGFQSNSIRNCSTGLFLSSSGAGILGTNNSITENSTGIYCNGYTYPLIFSNKIYDNGTNIYISSLSSPDFGRYADQGRNSIYWGTPCDISSDYSGTIWAKYNWWGNYPPYPFISGTVDYSNALESDPNQLIKKGSNREYSPIILKKTIRGKIIQKIEIPGLKEVDESRGLFSLGKYEEAFLVFDTLLNKYSNYLSGEISLFFIDECLNLLKRESERKGYIENVIKNKGKNNISGAAQLIQRKYLIKERNFDKAINNALSTKTDFQNSHYEIYALYDIGTIYWNYLGNRKLGEIYYRELINKYPDDPLAELALLSLGEWKPKDKEFEKSVVTLKSKFSDLLEHSYPNPFNPSTNIRYSLPIDCKVTIKIYSSIGQEITTLANGIQQTGYYNIVWNGSDKYGSKVSSGLYLLRIFAEPLEGGNSLTQTQKLILMK